MLTGMVSFAQQDAQFTQYMYNTININPAYAGSRGAMSIFGLYRTQWVGLDGAPTTATASMHTPINDTNLGIGVSFVTDKIGPTVENAISVDVSYTVPVSEQTKLSFGIKGTGNFFKFDNADLNPVNQADPTLQNVTEFKPNIGAGVYLHSDKFYVGLSVPNFIENKNKFDANDISVYTEKMNYYIIGGYVFDISPTVKFKPAILSKIVVGAPLQLDGSANFMFFDKLVLGAAYRWDAAWSGMAGFQVTDALYLGYAYDHETTNLKSYNSGSHEIFLRFELFSNYNKIISPRFF